MSSEPAPPRLAGLERLEFPVGRLEVRFRCTYAFHAREVRFERDAGEGFAPLFPETFSFHAERHDPAELYLQLEDLQSAPQRLSPRAQRRDGEELVRRLLAALPGYLDAVLDRLQRDDRPAASLLRACEDVAVLGLVAARFLRDKGFDERRLRLADFRLRKLVLRALLFVVEERIRPETLAAYRAGLLPRPEEPSEAVLFHALAAPDPTAREAVVLAAAEQAFHRWLEEVCLEETNEAFETEDSPFSSREAEVLHAVCGRDRRRAARGRHLSPFLRRAANKDCARLLEKLETWFLRQYDVHHAAVVIYHAANLAEGRDDADQVLSFHSPRNYVLAIAVLASPFLAAALLFDRAPALFNGIATAMVAGSYVTALWFVGYRFCWRKDLTFFHAWVPRIFAGIIVGYLPVFLIDEVWDLARQSAVTLGALVLLLGATTLLYIYVEVQRRIGDRQEAFARARGVFLIGLLEAAALGLIVTSLLGPFMALRNWAPPGFEGTPTELALEPVLGGLPMMLGVETYLHVFPTAILLMTFLSFFIGTFLQLLWEDFPITEPL